MKPSPITEASQADTLDLPTPLQDLVRKLRARTDWKAAELAQLLRASPIQAEDLLPWADWDHPAADSYGRRLVYQDAYFEVMVMSWAPGDFSTIHDHGYTQWGAVKVFGAAEHATFRLEGQTIRTLRRWRLAPGDVVGVSHDLLHQMGNPLTDGRFLSLHVYGLPEARANVTGDARLMELYRGRLQRVNGGVFFALPPDAVEREEPGLRADWPTRFRHLVELAQRLRRMQAAGLPTPGYALKAVQGELFHPRQMQGLLKHVRSLTDADGHIQDRRGWDHLNQELRAGARLLREGDGQPADRFQQYADVYDKVIGQPCLEGFTADYLRFFREQSGLDLGRVRALSLGVGTGLTEAFLIEQMGVPQDRLLGIDKSPAMVEVARRRLATRQADLMDLPAELGRFDLIYSGLNVLQYLPPEGLETAIAQAAGHLEPGGYFLGDFIAPDHIDQYPNAIVSAREDVISLRTPRLFEEGGHRFQGSSILNVDILTGQLNVHAAGEHRRHLPELATVRAHFERHFGGRIALYDAYSLQELAPDATTSPSTRYVVIARRAV